MADLRVMFVDLDGFFASVEQQLRPECRGRPVAVAAEVVETTCCIASSYEAKAFGVRTGTPVAEARRRCPGIAILPSRPREYVRFHHAVRGAVESCAPVEAVESIDEMWCRLIGEEGEEANALALAGRVKRAVRERAGACLGCSVGLAPNRFLAKVATDLRKPDGTVVIRPRDLPHALYELALEDLPGIGPRMGARLRGQGVTTVERLCAMTADELARAWRGVLGRMWWHWLRGLEWHRPPTRRRTVGHSHVLPPALRSDAGGRAVAVRLVHKAAARLRAIDHWALHLDVYVSYGFREEGWRATLALGWCQDTLTMVQALAAVWPHRPPGRPTQVAVTLHGLAPSRCVPLPLFDGDRHRAALSRAMDRLNAAHGPDTVYFAGMWGALDSAPTRISFTHIPTFDPAEP